MGEEFIDKEYCRSMFSMIYQNIQKNNSFDTYRAISFVLSNDTELFDENNTLILCFKGISKTYKMWDNEKDSQIKDDLFNDILSKLLFIYTLFLKNVDLHKSQIFFSQYQTKINELMQTNISLISPQLNMICSDISKINDRLSKFENIDVVKEKEDVIMLRKYLEDSKQRVDIIIGDIAENKNAGKYKEYYENCRKSARGLFWFSLLIMGSVAGIVGWHLWNIETLESAKLLIRIPMAFLVLLPSFFMMREAKKLKDKEFQYYDMMCRIVTSAPYIDGLTHLDDNQKDQMKADLVKDFFARPIECRDDGGLVPIEEICKIIKVCNNE